MSQLPNFYKIDDIVTESRNGSISCVECTQDWCKHVQDRIEAGLDRPTYFTADSPENAEYGALHTIIVPLVSYLNLYVSLQVGAFPDGKFGLFVSRRMAGYNLSDDTLFPVGTTYLMLGYISPEEGRRVARLMYWDFITGRFSDPDYTPVCRSSTHGWKAKAHIASLGKGDLLKDRLSRLLHKKCLYCFDHEDEDQGDPFADLVPGNEGRPWS